MTTASVVATDVLYGIAVAVGLSVLDLLRRIGTPPRRCPRLRTGAAGMHDVSDHAGAEQVEGMVVYRYDAPLFFADAEHFRRRALAAVDDGPEPVHWFLLDAEAVVEIDLTAADTLEEVRSSLEARGLVFAMARVKHELLDSLRAARFAARLGEEHVFPMLPTAVAAYEAWRTRRGARGVTDEAWCRTFVPKTRVRRP